MVIKGTYARALVEHDGSTLKGGLAAKDKAVKL